MEHTSYYIRDLPSQPIPVTIGLGTNVGRSCFRGFVIVINFFGTCAAMLLGDNMMLLIGNLWKVKIENAFGMLKCKWQILCNMNVELSSVPTVVLACGVLHNYVILYNDDVSC